MNSFILSVIRIKPIRYLLLIFMRIGLFQKRTINKYLRRTVEPKLQIGCGTNPLAGWLNTGISLRECWYGCYLDAGKPFPLPNASFDYVYSEHLFEHLTYQQAMNMLKESYRVLKPGGIFRIATPDLQFLMRLYQEPEKPLHRQYMEYSVRECGLPSKAVYIISRFHTSWGHQIIYDKETLIGLLEETGFRDITPCEVGKSEHPALNDIEGHFKELPYEFDLLETMIFEATK